MDFKFRSIKIILCLNFFSFLFYFLGQYASYSKRALPQYVNIITQCSGHIALVMWVLRYSVAALLHLRKISLARKLRFRGICFNKVIHGLHLAPTTWVGYLFSQGHPGLAPDLDHLGWGIYSIKVTQDLCLVLTTWVGYLSEQNHRGLCTWPQPLAGVRWPMRVKTCLWGIWTLLGLCNTLALSSNQVPIDTWLSFFWIKGDIHWSLPHLFFWVVMESCEIFTGDALFWLEWIGFESWYRSLLVVSVHPNF